MTPIPNVRNLMTRQPVDKPAARDAALSPRSDANAPPSRRAFLATALSVGGASLVADAASAAPPAEPDALLQVPSFENRLTRAYGVRVPFVGAGMGFVAMPELVAAVSNAGGIGILGNAIEPALGTTSLIQQIKLATGRPFGVDFIVDDSAFGPMTTDDHIDACIGEQVKLVVFHMNLPSQEWVDRLHGSGARVWAQVGSVDQAVAAARLGIDAVIAQGSEAGGHNKSRTPLLVLLPAIVRAVHPMMVLAAGGISDGQSVFRAMAAGADGVWVGTRLVASREACAHAAYKTRLVAAGQASTVTTTMFGPEYPGRPYRVLRNRIVNEFAGRESTIPDPPPPPAAIGTTLLFPKTERLAYTMPKFSAIVPTPDTVGDFEEMGMPAGAGVAAIRSIQPVAQIVASMMSDARECIRQADLSR
jgi:NAD(P)H-dependent flavin oxidoreductase YrpB (nitropropane dioxygenase family)